MVLSPIASPAVPYESRPRQLRDSTLQTPVSLVIALASLLVVGCQTTDSPCSKGDTTSAPAIAERRDATPSNSFADRLLPAPSNGGFALEDYWVWGGSVIRAENGCYHMFVSRWSKRVPFLKGYPLYSEIVHAVSDTPEGPYTFQDVALPDRGSRYWDGRMTTNPTIHKYGDTYLLFYIGSTFEGPRLTAEQIANDKAGFRDRVYRRIRIGLATSTSPDGPWVRRDKPILEPRPGKWDAYIVTNPAPCVLPDGRILLVYRSNTPAGLRLGVAMADNFESPFYRLHDDPVLTFEDGSHVEDPYIWWAGDHYEMLSKDLTGTLSGQWGAGLHATSDDAIHWRLSDPPQAYTRRVVWDDGRVTVQGALERPQLLIQDGRPTHLFLATGDGPGRFDGMTRTWNMVIPLR